MKSYIKKKLRKTFYKGPTKQLYRALSKYRINKDKKLDDVTFIKKKFKENTGLDLNLSNPKLFNEKINWLKLFYRDELITKCTDKVAVREYVKMKGYPDILVPLINTYDNANEIDFDNLPEKVFIKTNHTSGYNAIYNRKNSDINQLRKYFDKALKTNYYYVGREWNYKDINPKVVIEPFIDMSKFDDYKFFMFNGKLEYYAVIRGIIDEKGQQSSSSLFNLYNKDDKPLDVKVDRKKFDDSNYKFPEQLIEIKKIAEDLSSPFPFCRVDFLVNDNKFYFGEITFFPNGGMQLMNPIEKEYYYGNLIDLNKLEKNKVIK
ncbi:ATP-grasp fold amidoligase family protein [Macrococcoides caseolyticum]|uniref:ATP-grasp fold amidoligase family protein n=1 Tax=Macrococcoides caseolyticum TaxID=69966 RepID=UPI0024BC66AF|nr:ATP-grasp fold amidoligase family protein [Macrococcus caseolyticus]MDJ1088756.1 ATP-grasp fold amidoligase family protein [Macrococcus caseolyticus]